MSSFFETQGSKLPWTGYQKHKGKQRQSRENNESEIRRAREGSQHKTLRPVPSDRIMTENSYQSGHHRYSQGGKQPGLEDNVLY